MIGRLTSGLVPLALVAASAVALAEAPHAAEAQVTIADGIVLDLSMSGVVSPSSTGLDSWVQVHDGELYRLVVDSGGRARFSYAIRVEPRGTGVELVFRPVRLHEAMRAFAPRQRTYTLPFRLESGLVTLPDTQTSGPVSAGDEVVMDMFDNRETGQRIGDRVRVVAVSSAAVARLAASRKARWDSRVVLTVAGVTIRRSGLVIHHDRPGTLATGHTIALGLGQQVGTVIVSAEPPQNEVPYGVATVEGRTLRFTLDGDEYECTGTEPIGPEGLTSVWMYVRREPLPHVKGHWVGAGESVDALMRMWQTRPR